MNYGKDLGLMIQLHGPNSLQVRDFLQEVMQSCVSQAEEFLQMKQPEQAVQILTYGLELLQQTKQNGCEFLKYRSFYIMGNAYLAQSRVTQSLNAFLSAFFIQVEEKITNPELPYKISQLYLEKSQLDKALSYVEQAYCEATIEQKSIQSKLRQAQSQEEEQKLRSSYQDLLELTGDITLFKSELLEMNGKVFEAEQILTIGKKSIEDNFGTSNRLYEAFQDRIGQTQTLQLPQSNELQPPLPRKRRQRKQPKVTQLGNNSRKSSHSSQKSTLQSHWLKPYTYDSSTRSSSSTKKVALLADVKVRKIPKFKKVKLFDQGNKEKVELISHREKGHSMMEKEHKPSIDMQGQIGQLAQLQQQRNLMLHQFISVNQQVYHQNYIKSESNSPNQSMTQTQVATFINNFQIPQYYQVPQQVPTFYNPYQSQSQNSYNDKPKINNFFPSQVVSSNSFAHQQHLKKEVDPQIKVNRSLNQEVPHPPQYIQPQQQSLTLYDHQPTLEIFQEKFSKAPSPAVESYRVQITTQKREKPQKNTQEEILKAKAKQEEFIKTKGMTKEKKKITVQVEEVQEDEKRNSIKASKQQERPKLMKMSSKIQAVLKIQKFYRRAKRIREMNLLLSHENLKKTFYRGFYLLRDHRTARRILLIASCVLTLTKRKHIPKFIKFQFYDQPKKTVVFEATYRIEDFGIKIGTQDDLNDLFFALKQVITEMNSSGDPKNDLKEAMVLYQNFAQNNNIVIFDPYNKIETGESIAPISQREEHLQTDSMAEIPTGRMTFTRNPQHFGSQLNIESHSSQMSRVTQRPQHMQPIAEEILEESKLKSAREDVPSYLKETSSQDISISNLDKSQPHNTSGLNIENQLKLHFKQGAQLEDQILQPTQQEAAFSSMFKGKISRKKKEILQAQRTKIIMKKGPSEKKHVKRGYQVNSTRNLKKDKVEEQVWNFTASEAAMIIQKNFRMYYFRKIFNLEKQRMEQVEEKKLKKGKRLFKPPPLPDFRNEPKELRNQDLLSGYNSEKRSAATN